MRSSLFAKLSILQRRSTGFLTTEGGCDFKRLWAFSAINLSSVFSRCCRHTTLKPKEAFKLFGSKQLACDSSFSTFTLLAFRLDLLACRKLSALERPAPVKQPVVRRSYMCIGAVFWPNTLETVARRMSSSVLDPGN